MRLIYLDEAGVANVRQEPHIVVAGTIINPDDLAFEIANHLNGIARKYVSDPIVSDGLIFHASDIWHGAKYFNREQWPHVTRLRLLHDLASIPSIFGLPIIYGHALRSEVARWAHEFNPDISAKDLKINEHCVAFFDAIENLERWMKIYARNERALLIVEDTPIAKNGLKAFHSGYRFYPNRDDDYLKKAFESNHITETILFAEKTESAALQIADVAAFFIRRHLAQKADSEVFYNLLKPQIFGE